MANFEPTTGEIFLHTHKSSDIKGVSSASNAQTGRIGEFVNSAVGPVNAAATTQWKDITSISLTAGDWDVNMGMLTVVNGATVTSGTWDFGISAGASGNAFDDVVISYNYEAVPHNASGTCGTIPRFRVNVGVTTTVYAKGRVAFSAGTPQWYAALTARRIR